MKTKTQDAKVRKKFKPNEKTLAYIRRITMDAMLIALFLVLNTIGSIEINQYMKITPASFAVIICATLYGPADACIVAAGGEFLNQLLKYGFSPTMPLWMIPPTLRGLVIGLFALYMFKKGKYPEKRTVLFYITCIIGSIVTSAATTGVSYIDAKMYGYFNPTTFGISTAARFTSSMFTAAILATLSVPICIGLRRAKIGIRLPASVQSEDNQEKSKNKEQ